MKATNKKEFFELLESELRRIGIDDDTVINDIFADFEEHFTDGAMQGTPEDVTAERLGDIKEIARSYLNLESSRINSIMARDVERRKVSLTKPGRGVPADLSLIGSDTARDIANSDNIREYTPQHYSSEIYPQSPNNNVYGNSGNNATGANQASDVNNANGVNNTTNVNYGHNTGNTAGNASAGGAAVNGAENKSVADAFSDAGRAALDAAKITGQAVADAFKNSGVKQAVVGAGKTAADAVKSAGEAVKQAVKPHKRQHNGSVPYPSDTYRENMSTVHQDVTRGSQGVRQGSQPTGSNRVRSEKKSKKSGYKLINVSQLTPNVNATKLLIAILLDVFLWGWLIPAIIGGLAALLFGGAFGAVIRAFSITFNTSYEYYFISRLFLGFTWFWLGIACLCVVVFLGALFMRLVKFVINLHIKAIYDL